MTRTAKIIVCALVGVPALFLGQCMYQEVSQPRELSALCSKAARGSSVEQLLAGASANSSFKARTGGSAGKDERDWFDREYLRLGQYLRKTKNLPDDYTVVFAKPGVGYHACIATHAGGVVKEAWIEDRSS